MNERTAATVALSPDRERKRSSLAAAAGGEKKSHPMGPRYNAQSINHCARRAGERTFGILVPTPRGFGTPAEHPRRRHASFDDERDRAKEVFATRTVPPPCCPLDPPSSDFESNAMPYGNSGFAGTSLDRDDGERRNRFERVISPRKTRRIAFSAGRKVVGLIESRR